MPRRDSGKPVDSPSCRDPLDRAAADAELLGDLVKPAAPMGDDHAVNQVRDWNVLGRGQCALQRPCAIAAGAIPG
jgi:hypothetical protein